jgi:hypothetical protein
VSVDPFHLFLYLDEQMFRYSGRRLADAERFVIVLAQSIGRRITYAEPTTVKLIRQLRNHERLAARTAGTAKPKQNDERASF